jgi:hypothetical protein
MITSKEQRVINLYMIDKLSAYKIAELEKLDRKTVYRLLKRNNVKIRTLSEAAMTYQCDDHSFSVIDTEEKAYWLGALYADGNVSKTASRSGQIFLTSTDKEWIGEFMRFIKSTNSPRSEYHVKFKKFIWKAQITSAIMYEDLVSHGCVPVKSKVIKVPELDSNLMYHFVRGYFDGDGTVGVYKNLSTHDWKILKSGLCSGSKEFLYKLVDILPVKNKKVSYNGVYIIQFSLRDSLKLYDYLYKDCNVWLVRKRNVFEDYIKTYNPRKRFNDYNR